MMNSDNEEISLNAEETKNIPRLDQSPSKLKRSGMLRHFITEVKFLRLLQHPNIIKVFESETNKPLPIKIPTASPLMI